MIELYTWKTANCQKVNIALAELGLHHNVHAIDLSKGHQKLPEHITRNPNGKVPVIVDHAAGVTLFESGAILLYLAEKTQRLIPQDFLKRWQATQWVFWQMSSLGPNAGQVIHFGSTPDRGEYAFERFQTELKRLMEVLENALANNDFIAGEYSMADIAIWPWISRFEKIGLQMTLYPEIKRWYLTIAQRPGVIAGVKLLQPNAGIATP